MSTVSTTRSALLLSWRDIAAELRSREATVATAPFVVALVVLAGMAFGPTPRVLHAAGPGTVWLVVLVGTVPLTHTVAEAEHGDDTWDLLRCLVPPSALLAGKLAFTWLALLTCWATVALVGGALLGGITFSVSLAAGALLGTLGLAAVTTVFGVLTGGGRRTGLPAVLLLPAGLPALVAGTQTATPGVPHGAWLALLGAYDALILTAAWAVFPVLLEE